MALTTNLVSYWKLDEASGNAADSVGSNTLTNNNSTAYAAGKINNGGDFEFSNSNSMSIADASQSGLDITGDLSISAWLKVESVPSAATYTIAAKYDSGSANKGYQFAYEEDTGLKLSLYISTAGSTNSVARVLADLGTGTFHHCVCVYDSVAGSTEMFVDGASIGSVGSQQTGIFNNAAAFRLGARNGTATDFMDGIIDEVGIWSRKLTGAEVTSLYNGGAGFSYPFVVGSLPLNRLIARQAVNRAATY